MTNNPGKWNEKAAMTNPLLWAVFIGYSILLGIALFHHELWSDEMHSWNIAKSSRHYSELLSNLRYEGHPPAWHTLLWLISKFSHNIACMRLAQGLLACATVFLVLFASSFPMAVRILIPFGYYFIFEYGVFSRNYMIAVLAAFLICRLLQDRSPASLKNPSRLAVYYILLFFLSNTHLLGLLLAGSLHLYFLMSLGRDQSKKRTALHALAGLLIALPAAWLIYPPADSQTNIHFLMDLSENHPLAGFSQPPLQAFIPLPAWWEPHFWNTQFLVVLQNSHPWIRYLILSLAVSVSLVIAFILKNDKKSLTLFFSFLILCFAVHIKIYSLLSARHAGFLFIAFLVAYWLYCYEQSPAINGQKAVLGLLLIQLAAGLFCIAKDISLPFSYSDKVAGFIREIPPGEKLVTTYWSMNTLVAYDDHPVYCIDEQQELRFVLLDSRLADVLKRPDRYSTGLHAFFNKNHIEQTYMVSLLPPAQLFKNDKGMPAYRIDMIDQRDGAIEKGSNLYLFKITTVKNKK